MIFGITWISLIVICNGQTHGGIELTPIEGCTFNGKNFSSGERFELAADVRPHCIECMCLFSEVHCNAKFEERGPMGVPFFTVELCFGNNCIEFEKRLRPDCANPLTFPCEISTKDVTWSQDGCQYSCINQTWNAVFVNPQWCQRLLSSNMYCATTCPDKELALQRYSDVFQICTKKEAIVYNEEICDGSYDCHDQTDEDNCTEIYCKAEEYKIFGRTILWAKTGVGKNATLACSLFSRKWKGSIRRLCHPPGNSTDASAQWNDVDECGCTPPSTMGFEIKNPSWSEEIVAQAEDLLNLTRGSLYSTFYIANAELLLVTANRASWNNRSLAETFINAMREIISPLEMCSTPSKQGRKEALYKGLVEFASNNWIFMEFVPVEPTISKSIIFSGLNDLSLNMNDLELDLKSKLELRNISIQSTQEIERIRTELREIKENIEIRNDLQTVELVTTSISLACVIFALALFYILRIGNSTRIFLHKSLLVAYALFCTLTIIGSTSLIKDLRKYQVSCTVYLMMFHYAALATFTWMLMEGVHLLIILVVVFQMKRERRIIFFVVGWGVPFLITAILFAVDPNSFLQNKTCQSLGSKVWRLKGPVLGIVVINFAIALLVLITILKNQRRKSMNKKETTRSVAKAFLVLAPLLGFFWIFSIFTDEHIAFAAIAAVLNGLTGFSFFVFHCCLDKQVQLKARKSNMFIFKWITAPIQSTNSKSQTDGGGQSGMTIKTEKFNASENTTSDSIHYDTRL